jgi:hypothetical protein
MELLYLYIEEFKSIQQQEFLLTPDPVIYNHE